MMAQSIGRLMLKVFCVMAFVAEGMASDCEQKTKLGVNDSFVFTRFPPEYSLDESYWMGAPVCRDRSQSAIYGTGAIPLGSIPEEFTWIFVATTKDCVLEFRARHWERGVIDCEEQYFLIGDENSETRICGFRKPPKRLASTGKELFISHYKRNGRRYRTIPSYLGGSVRCLPRPPGPPPGPSCSPSLKCTSKAFTFPPSSNWESRTALVGSNILLLDVAQECLFKPQCTLNATACNMIGCEDGTSIPPPTFPPDCHNGSIQCTTPACDWSDLVLNADNSIHDKLFSSCATTSGQFCTHTVTLCSSLGT